MEWLECDKLLWGAVVAFTRNDTEFKGVNIESNSKLSLSFVPEAIERFSLFLSRLAFVVLARLLNAH